MDETKQTKPIEIKRLSEAGTGLARIATMSAVDSDGDTYAPGAFGGAEGQTVKVLAAHDQLSVPLGKGRIFERGEEALAEFKLNLETRSGREWHSALKFDLDNPPATQEWSFGFRVLDSAEETRDGEDVRVLKKLDVFEISPVVLGAGVNTATLAAKDGQKRAIPRHETPTSRGAWDGPANERRIEAGDSLPGNGPRAYAWRDPDGDPETKAAWRFIHHFVGADGTPGAASTRAAITGIAVLNGARGGTTIPDSDRRGVWNHLAGHLRDAAIEPPELRESGEETGAKFLAELLILRFDIKRASVLAGEVLGGEKLSADATDIMLKAAELGVDPQALFEAMKLEIDDHGGDNTQKYRMHLAMRGLHSV